MDTQNLYFQLIKDIANELVKSGNFELLDFIQGRMDEIAIIADAYMDNQLSILENQSTEC
jgi:hypothetical protein